MKQNNIDYLYRIVLVLVLTSVIFGSFAVLTQYDEEPAAEELFEGEFAYNFGEGECKYFKENDAISEEFERINTSNIDLGEYCSTYHRLNELKINFSNQENNEELTSKGLSAIENGELNTAELINAKTESHLSFIFTLISLHSTKILFFVLTIVTAFAIDFLLRTFISLKVKNFAESTLASLNRDSNLDKQFLKELLEIEEELLENKYISAYFKYRRLKQKR